MKKCFHKLEGDLQSMAYLLCQLSRSEGIAIPTKEGRIDIDAQDVEKVEIKIYVNEKQKEDGIT